MGALDKDGEVSITAYSAIVLAENFATLDVKQQDTLLAAETAMVSQLENELSDHTLAMVCYCFHLTSHPQAVEVLELIMSRAERKAGYVQWMDKWERPSVEIASYVLLSYSLQEEASPSNDALPVFIGIQREMSETGGFSTTQDTVIGIQAMSAYALLMNSPDSVAMSIETDLLDNGDNVIKSSPQVQVDDDNKMIVQIENVDFTGSVSQLDVKSSGVGSIYVQIVQHYYIPDTTVEPFAVEVVVVENDTAVKRRRREADNTKVSLFF